MLNPILLSGLTLLAAISVMSCGSINQHINASGPLAGIKITVDAGHGDTKAYDRFRVGPTGEREEWINLRVAKQLARKLRQAGADVTMTRIKDRDVSLGGRASLAKIHKSDLFVSVHHNGSGNDPNMDLPIVYFFGSASENPASVDFAQILLGKMRQQLSFEQPDAGGVYSDHLIYSSGTSVLRNTVNHMPGAIGEGGFFTHAKGEKRLKKRSYNLLEAQAYYEAILEYVGGGLPKAQFLVPDSIEYLDLSKDVVVQLDDGFGSSFFDPTTFALYQDDVRLPVKWSEMDGTLTFSPKPTEEIRTTFRVYGRNFKGNALHPRPFTFLTQTGAEWYCESSWREAFKKALQVEKSLKSASSLEEELQLVEDALHFYRLSLELQIVHERVQVAEKRILVLMERQLKLGSPLVDQEQVDAQRERILEYYPAH